ncbi:MAG: LysM peptidoglycan-binding domain-containing protein, partial [Proteobacteria bacterium]|nr:LysM peptidoglycan-binding domain-containing protein [Pseudomonadota bacterium]
FAARDMTPASDKSFRESVMTFRRMSVKESAGIKPLHIRVATVKAGDTIETLASRMATDHKLERFLVLNGFQAHDTLKPGQKVKVVME